MTTRRWVHHIARRKRLVFVVWAILVIASLAGTPYLNKQLGAPGYGVPGSQSAQVSGLLARYFSGRGSEQDVVVFQARAGVLTTAAGRREVGKILDAVRHTPHVAGTAGPFGPGVRPQVSGDGRSAFALVGLDGSPAQLAQRAAAVQAAVQQAAGGDIQAWLTGYSPITNDLDAVEISDSEHAESFGLTAAFVVLLLALGSLVAALLPLLLAVAGLLLTFGVVTLLTFVMSEDSILVAIVTMIGLGVGIDYALFIVSRFREEMTRRGAAELDGRRRSEAVADAVAAALATSGRTIVYSGAILGLSMCSLLVVNSPIFREMSIGVLAVVASTLAAAWTLLPAVLVVLGPRVNRLSLPRRLRPSEVRADLAPGQTRWARMARTVMRHPVLACVLVTGLLVVAALPLGGLRYGINLGTASLAGRPSARAEQVLARSFGTGLESPVQVVVTGPGNTALDMAGLRRAEALAASLREDPQITEVQAEIQGGRVLLDAVPAVTIDSTAASQLIIHIRNDLVPKVAGDTGLQVLVGGASAQFVDASHETSSKIPYILAIVLGLALVFLLLVFRSIVLPVKAVAMNVLATAASVGLTVAVFQRGYLHSLLRFTSVGYLQVYIPILVFVMLFGLSMDYEVFLIRRMREAWLETGDNQLAIATGIEHTARPIAAAAAIMVVVFGSFVSANVLEVKQFGLALAIAVAIDASLVRLVLVPAAMRLLGRWNWWLPGARFANRADLTERIPTTSSVG